MTTEHATVALVTDGKITGSCQLEFSRQQPWQITLTQHDGQTEHAQADSLPEALAKIRTALGTRGIDLACQGCRSDVRPSQMSIQSGGGRHSYVIRLGASTRREDIVDIFAPTDIKNIASVEQQALYAQKWLDSLQASDGERAEARSHAGGWVYRIDGHVDPAGEVPPEAIIGAWKVDESGELTGEFKRNDA